MQDALQGLETGLVRSPQGKSPTQGLELEDPPRIFKKKSKTRDCPKYSLLLRGSSPFQVQNRLEYSNMTKLTIKGMCYGKLFCLAYIKSLADGQTFTSKLYRRRYTMIIE